MPRRLQMGDLRTRCLQQCDLDKDGAFTVDVSLVNAMMSAQYGQLYTSVADAGLRYFESSTTFTASGGNTISEPADHLATVDTIERLVDATSQRYQRLKQLMPQERSRWSGRTGSARRWELVDDLLYLYPTPPSGEQYVLRYIAQPPDLVSYSDVALVDVVNPAGEDFMIWGCCVRFLAKVKSDVTLAIAERNAARSQLEEWARDRAFNDSPRRIVEFEGSDGDPDYDGWYP